MPRLLGPDGLPINTVLLKSRIATPTMTGVRQVQSGHPAQGLDPSRLSNILRAAEGGSSQAYLELAEEMEEKYLHYLSVVSTRKRAIAGLAIEVEPADDSAEAARHAEVIQQSLPSIKEALYDVLDAVGKAFSVSEIMWDTSESQWQPIGLEWNDPRWFQFSRFDGRTLNLRDDSAMDGLPLAPYKFVQHRVSAKSGLPIRGGIARAASWAYLFHNFGMKDWIVFLEVFGHPLRLGKYDSTAQPEDIQVLLDAVRDIGSDAAAVIPKSMEIDFPAANGSKGTSDLWERLLEYLDRQISKAVLGQTLTSDTGQKGGGSYALGSIHNEVRMDILHSDVRQLEATLARDWTKPAIDLNFGIQKNYPRIKIVIEEKDDLAALANNLEKLVPQGAQVPVTWVNKKFNIPMPKDGEAILTPAVRPAPADNAQALPNTTAQRAAHTQGAPAPTSDALDGLRDLALEGWQSAMQPITHPIIANLDAALAANETLEQFRDRLAVLLAQADPSALALQIGQAQFVARLAGEAGLPVDPQAPDA